MLRKILVVDDSELLHRMYDLVLLRYRQVGAVILHARNGAEALSMLREHREIDLVLLDINMPVMNGLETLVELNRSGQLPHLKVIMVSTEGHEEDVRRAILSGATAYVTKPFSPTLLHELISTHVLDTPLAAIRAGR
jgi:two-component system, chemotaxis family, chemotaxis protein CheY